MFHHQTKKLATLAIGLGLIFTPATSFAENAIAPAQTTQAKSSTLKDISFQDIRNETEEKIFETRVWMKNHKAPQDIKNLVKEMEQATDRLQNKVAPTGRSIKSFASKTMPGKDLLQRGDKTFTVFGLILMMAFGFAFLVMNLANPESRTGGRH